MIEVSAYPRPVPLSASDALALATTVGEWPDVSGAFIVYEMLGIAEREGEWRFAGAANSLAGVFERLVEFGVAFGSDSERARASIDDLLRSWAIAVFPRLEDGWSAGGILSEVPRHRVVYFGEAQAPYENHGLCILEIEPGDAGPFFARAPETQWPQEWFEQDQWNQQREASDAE